MDNPTYMRVKEAANFLGISETTLNCWRSSKRYPLNYHKIGKCVRYKLEDLINFAAQSEVHLNNLAGE